MTFAERLNVCMLKKGLNSTELGKRVGVARQTVSFWKSGRNLPSRALIPQIAELLDTSAEWLLSGKESNGPEVRAFLPGEKTPPPGFVSVPEYRVTFAAGGPNGEPTWEEVHEAEESWYRASFFERRGIRPERCKRVRVTGDSMEPFLFSGDRVLIEEELSHRPGDVKIEDGAIYVVNIEGDCRVKRLAKIKNGIRVISDNAEKYPPEDYVNEEADRILIYGRVHEVCRSL